MTEAREIKLGAILSYITIAFNITAGLLYTPWMIRQIGNSDYALYIMATSIIALLMMDFGLGSATSKFIAEYNAKKEYDKANEYIANSLVIFTFISLIIFVVVVVMWFFLDVIYKNLSSYELGTFKSLYLIVGTYSVLLFPFTPLNSVLGGWGKFFELKLSVLVQRVLNVVFIVIALLGGLGVFSLVLVNAITGIVMTLLQLFFVKRIRLVRLSHKMVDRNVIKSIAGFSLWLLISQVCQNLLANLAPTIVGANLTTTDVTLFSVSLTLERYVLTFSTGINGLFLPKVSSIITDTENREKRIMELMIKVGKTSLSIVGCIIVGYKILGRWFVDLWMGSAYEDIYINALILMLPLLISSSQQIGYAYIMASGEIRYQSLTDLVTSLIGFVLLFVLTRMIGVVGASIGFSISLLLNSVIMNILFVKILHIDIVAFYKNTYLKWILCCFLSLCAGYFVTNYFIVNRWIELFIAGAMILVIYGAITVLIYFNRKERIELLSFIRR